MSPDVHTQPYTSTEVTEQMLQVEKTAANIVLTEWMPNADNKDARNQYLRGDFAYGYELLPILLTVFIGTSNLAVFPKLMMLQNGGASFLAPYIIGLFIFTIPSTYLEVYIGQYCRAVAYKSYQMFAPIMGVIPIITALSISIGAVQALLNMTFAWQVLFNLSTVSEWTRCHFDQPTCISLHNDRSCALMHKTNLSDLRYLYTVCHWQTKDFLIYPEQLTLPTIEYFYSNISVVSDTMDTFGEFNIQGYTLSLVFIVLICSILLLPIRFYVLIAMLVQASIFFLLFILILYTQFAQPFDVKALNIRSIHFPMRSSKIQHALIWRLAFMLSMKSQSLGQGTIPTVSMYTKRNDYTIKWVILASLGDFLFSLLGSFYMDGLLSLLAATVRHYGINPYDFDRQTHAMIFGATIQALSYYGNPSFIVLHLLLIFLVVFNSFFGIALALRHLLQGFFLIERPVMLSLALGGYLAGCQIFFFFQTYDLQIRWLSTSRECISCCILGLQVAFFIAVYGMRQLKFDVIEMLGIPENRWEKFWSLITMLNLKCYKWVVPPVTGFLIGCAFLKKSNFNPLPIMKESSFTYFILMPPVLWAMTTLIIWPIYQGLKKKCQWSELMSVQEDLSSYRYLRTEVIGSDKRSRDQDGSISKKNS